MKKENVAREVANKLGIPFSTDEFTSENTSSGGGGNVSRAFFAVIYERISGKTAEGNTKTKIIRLICSEKGMLFMPHYTSENSQSGGGSKVTKSFLHDLNEIL